MATDSARSTTSRAARHLWQVPAFLLGVVALVTVLVVRPHFAKDTAAGAERQLHDARKTLEQTPPDLAAAVQKAERCLALVERYPQFAGEANFLAGTAHLRMADDPGTPDAARERQQARQLLESAATLGVSDADQSKLNYRLAKVVLQLNGDPARTATLLEKSADADDPAEGYGLLATAYLRMAPPDLTKAQEAARQALDRALRTNDARIQGIARFRLGELYLQVKKTKEGRQMLSRVGPEAPPEQFIAARLQLGESYEETQEWASAARNWQVAKENAKLLNPADKSKIFYHLGRCLALDHRKEAAGVFEEAIALGGPEGQAAGLRLAEYLLESDPTAAVAALTAALQPVHSPDDFHNPLIAIEDVRAIVEKAAQSARDKPDWDLALKVVEQYAHVAVAGKDDEMAGQIHDAHGQALVEAAKKDAANQAAVDEQAREAFRQAAAAYERAVGKTPDPATQGTWLWQSAQLALRAGQSVRARDILVRATQTEGALTPEKTAEAWLLIGNTDQLNQRSADARTAYQKCLSLPGPFALKARIGLAKIDLSENHFDDVDRELQDVLKAVREGDQQDSDLQEQALFAWAEAAYQRQWAVKEELREYGTAEQRLLGAVQQYPDGPLAVRARVMLGLCFWNDARLKSRALERGASGPAGLSEDEKATYQRQRGEFLRKSAEQYEKVEEQMLAKERTNGRLTTEEADYLKKAAFWGTDCYFWMPKYEEAVRRYGALALRYQGRPEEMIALSQTWQSYVKLSQADKAAALVARMQESLGKIPDEAFDGRLETHKREFWINWLKEITKPAVPPAPPRASAAK